ncbi:glycosyltransferase BC10-like [Castanea sativa]|uniref:glycosyltransferase BC10-like n=1 Tax=Castanea sativa TaxID=21020 RepID=UPI003F653BD7
MTTKKGAAAIVWWRHVVIRWWSCKCQWKLKLLLFLCVALTLFALFTFHSTHSPPDISSSPHRLRLQFHGVPKIAFLFLARRNLPLDFLWDSFLENADVANFSIYVHSAPGFAFNESTSRSTFFRDRQLKNSIQVGWGESSMIQAERLLFDAALEDPANQRFILLSDSCVPLYNFSYIYNYVMASPKSFVDSFLDKKENRYNSKMSPVIPKEKWRKGSQWITLVRSHAEVIVDDEAILSAFKKFCKRRPPVDAKKGKLNIKLQKQHNCIPDEHYVQTLLAMSDLEGELERRTLTYTVWNQSATKMEHKGWHPFTFNFANAGAKQIKEIKDINHVYYETEFRTEWCRSNSALVPCFLFARKFSQGAAMRLLSDGVVGRADTSEV